MSHREDFAITSYFHLIYETMNLLLAATVIMLYVIIQILIDSSDVKDINKFDAQMFPYIKSSRALDLSFSLIGASVVIFLKFAINYLRKEKNYL